MSDTAEECSKRFKRQNINSQRQLHTGIISILLSFLYPRGENLNEKRENLEAKKCFHATFFVPRG